MNVMHRLLASLTLGLLAPFLLVVPAHAEEVTPDPNPELTACEKREAVWQSEARWWEGQANVYEELYLSYRDAHELLSGVVNQWQLRVVDQAATIERQRERIDRLESSRDRLRARIAELRARLVPGRH